ncbi:MAG TPA: hypothetical protein DD643_07115 [Synechococcus sp. UBA8638]|nr:hypothetical protein [Synechococcus sp. UBA8638]
MTTATILDEQAGAAAGRTRGILQVLFSELARCDGAEPEGKALMIDTRYVGRSPRQSLLSSWRPPASSDLDYESRASGDDAHAAIAGAQLFANQAPTSRVKN